MTDHPRKEIIQVSGLSILVVMSLVGDLLIAGSIYRWHQYQVVLEEKQHLALITALRREEREVKDMIQRIDGVATWNETTYMKTLPITQ